MHLAAILLAGLTVLLAPTVAAAQALVRVHGTITWNTPFAVQSGRVYGLFEEVPLVIFGNQGTYEGLALANSHVFISAEISTCNDSGCAFLDPRNQLQMFLESDVGTEDLQLDFTLPADYTFESVSGSAELACGGTLGSGGRTLLVSQRFTELGQPVASHITMAPLDVVDATHATYDVPVAVGTVVTHVFFPEVVEFPPPHPVAFGPTPYELSSGQPLSLDPVVIFDDRGSCSPDVRVRGTITWDAPFAARSGRVSGLLEGEVPLVISGNQGTYEGTASPNSHVYLSAEISTCDGCPFLDPRNQLLMFFDSDVGTQELQLDFTLPADYTFESVSGTAELVGGGTLGSGGRTFFISQRFNELGQPVAQHITMAPLAVVDATHASYDVPVGVGTVFTHILFYEVVECPPPLPLAFGPAPYELIPGQPLSLEPIQLINELGTCTELGLRIELPSSGTATTVGAMYGPTAVVQNVSGGDISDAKLQFEVKGLARPRDWPGNCGATGYAEATDTSTVDCDLPPIAAGGEASVTLNLGALEPGIIDVTASAATPRTFPVSVSATVTATSSSAGNDLFFVNLEPTIVGAQHAYGSVSTEVVNAGPTPAHDVEVRFSTSAAVTWAEPIATSYKYLDLDPNSSREPELVCRLEPSSGDYVCVLPALDAWESATVDVLFFGSATAGLMAIQAEILNPGDPVPENNTAIATGELVPLQLADIQSSHSVLTANPSAGSPMLVEWRIHNAGPSPTPAVGFFVDPTVQRQAAHGVQAVYVVSAPEGSSCFVDSGLAICDIADLPPGETAVVHVETLPVSGGDLVTTSLADPVGLRFDPDPSNNTYDLTTHVTGPISFPVRVGYFTSMFIPCLGGIGVFVGFGDGRFQTAEQLARGGANTTNFARLDEGLGFILGTDLAFELGRGRLRAKDRIWLDKGKEGSTGEVFVYQEDVVWVQTAPLEPGEEGMTLRWRLTVRLEVDDLGRVFEVVDKVDVECRR